MLFWQDFGGTHKFLLQNYLCCHSLSFFSEQKTFRACADLYVMLCQDSSTETTYQASVCELEFVGSANDAGFHLRAYGFDHKLLCLAEKMISIYLSFRLPSEANTGVNLPNTIKPGRFQACLESLRRNYGNFGLKASGLCTNTRLRCLRPTIWSAHSKVRPCHSCIYI